MATIHRAASASESDVWGLINSAPVVNGDTVIIPTIGSPARWSQAHTLTKAITLQGENFPIIFDDLQQNIAWLIFNGVPNQRTRITGIDFRCGTALGNGALTGLNGGTFVFSGTTASALTWRIRVDHCIFTEFVAHKGAHVIKSDTAIGLIDHCNFIRQNGGIYVYCNHWPNANGGVQDNGDGSWAFPTHWADFNYALYVEDCVFDQSPLPGAPADQDPQGTFSDGSRGGRSVIRHCTFNHGTNSGNVVSQHGLEDRKRSIRHLEFYNNYIDKMNSDLVKQRGGTGVCFNVRVNQAKSAASTTFSWQYDRGQDPTNWGRASGFNKYDVNDANGGTNNAPIAFYSGTVASRTVAASGQTTQVTVAGTPWVTNEWTDFQFCDETFLINGESPDGNVNDQTNNPSGTLITGNDNNTLFLAGPTFGTAATHAYAVNDTFKIRKCDHAMDQIGRAGNTMAALVSGAQVMASGSNMQDSEPWYFWNNKRGSTDIPIGNCPGLRSNLQVSGSKIHYYVDGSVMPDYPVIDALATTKCGAQADSTGMPSYANGTMNVNVTGYWGAPYPHPDTQTTSPAVILGPFSKVFTFGVANTVDISVSGNPVPTITKTGALQSWATFADLGTGVARISGTPNNQNSATVTINATNGIGVADSDSFTLTVNNPNQSPAVNSLDSPTGGQTFVAPAIVTLTATASDPEGRLSKVEFYYAGSTLLASVDGTGPIFTATSPSLGAGTYAITAKAFDQDGGTSAASSTATITVTPSPALPAPNIVVTA